MKANIDDTLNRLARRTHSPRGQQAASDQIYQQLLDRIPAEQRPVIGQHKRRQHTFFSRWSAAACLLLVVGIGLAIAGVWYHQYYIVPSADNNLPVSGPSEANPEPRILVYQQTPLADIIAQLSESFDTSIQIANPDLRDYCITATFSTDEPLSEILSILAETGNFEVNETPEGFVIE